MRVEIEDVEVLERRRPGHSLPGWRESRVGAIHWGCSPVPRSRSGATGGSSCFRATWLLNSVSPRLGRLVR